MRKSVRWMCAAIGVAALVVGVLPASAGGARPADSQGVRDWVLLPSSRNADGSWSSWDEPSGTGTRVSAAGMADGSTQFALIGLNNLVYDIVRAPGGGYSQQLVPGPGSGGFAAGDVAVAKGPNGSAEVFATDYNSNLLYEDDLSAAGVWSGLRLVPGLTGASSFAVRHAAAAGLPNGSVRVLVTDPRKGYVYANTHNADGSWAGWQPLAGLGSGQVSAYNVAIAGLPDGSSQIALMNGGAIYHEVRSANGVDSGFQALPGVGGASTFDGWQVAITGMPDGSTQIIATDKSTNVFHQVRSANGTWSGWQPLRGLSGAADLAAVDVTIAGLPNGTAQVFAANE